ncbi:MAG: hypothetical protein AB1696_25030 [Planctomycetota bacterium]
MAKRNITKSGIRSFWKHRLKQVLEQPALLTAIRLGAQEPAFVTQDWRKYWSGCHGTADAEIDLLKRAWEDYIRSGFDREHAEQYVQAYLALLGCVTQSRATRCSASERLLSRVLAFENCVLWDWAKEDCMGLVTSDWRNPALVSLRTLGLRKHDRNDSALLPLAVASLRYRSHLFYHYRKQRFLKNTDRNLLFYLSADVALRGRSFQLLQSLTNTFAAEWDSRIEERSRLFGVKVIGPFLEARQKRMRPGRRALRVLDVGSGSGLLLSGLLKMMFGRPGVVDGRAEVSLVDIWKSEPKRHFRRLGLGGELAMTEYICRDYRHWLSRSRSCARQDYDVICIFRLFHNLSSFRIGRAAPPGLRWGRYQFFPHLSDYYMAIARLLRESVLSRDRTQIANSIYGPVRLFNSNALLLDNGRSVLWQLLRMGDNVVIEDADMCREDLVQHLSDFGMKNVTAIDLTRSLRLSINHVYWIAKGKPPLPLRGEQIWPR